MTPIRVLVVDDSAFMRNALARRIELSPQFKVIDTAADGQEAVRKALRLRPDVVTMDVEMPVMNGIEALRVLTRETDIPVIMVSAVTLEGARTTLEALDIGAVDFIPKARGAELIHEKLLAAAGIRKQRKTALQPPAQQGLARPVSRPPLAQSLKPACNPRLVVIGSSTGGPQALQQVITNLPKGTQVPVVVAQHMPPQFTLALAKRLDDASPLRVVEARDGDQLLAGTAYIAPGGSHLRVLASKISVCPDRGESLYKPSVDVLMESAHTAFGGQVLGVMLTGMGNDGTQEYVRVRKAGGYVLAQDEASCVVYGMPKCLVEAGGADEVLPLDQIAARIAKLISPR